MPYTEIVTVRDTSPAGAALGTFLGQSQNRPNAGTGISEILTNLDSYEHKGVADKLVRLQEFTGEGTSRCLGGSHLQAFANELGTPCVLVPNAQGGSAMHVDADNGNGSWTPGEALYDAAVANIQAAQTLTGLTLDFIIWCQGERDSAAIPGDISAAQYTIAFKAMADALKAEFPDSILLIVRTGRELGSDPHADVRAEQDGWDEYASGYVQMVETAASAYTDAGDYAADGIHWSQLRHNEHMVTCAQFYNGL